LFSGWKNKKEKKKRNYVADVDPNHSQISHQMSLARHDVLSALALRCVTSQPKMRENKLIC